MKSKSIYVVLTRTATTLSRLISGVTGDQYTHASIAMNKDLTAIYSFGRKTPRNPFIGGFKRENLNAGCFAASKKLPYAVIRFDVTPKQYEKANTIISTYLQNAAQYHYNYIGLIMALLGKKCAVKNRFYCSEFVYGFLRKIEAIAQEGQRSVRPQDFLYLGEIVEQGDWNENHKTFVVDRQLCDL